MTMETLMRKLARNALRFAEQGELVKAETCVEMIALIRERGFDNLRGRIELNDQTDEVTVW